MGRIIISLFIICVIFHCSVTNPTTAVNSTEKTKFDNIPNPIEGEEKSVNQTKKASHITARKFADPNIKPSGINKKDDAVIVDEAGHNSTIIVKPKSSEVLASPEPIIHHGREGVEEVHSKGKIDKELKTDSSEHKTIEPMKIDLLPSVSNTSKNVNNSNIQQKNSTELISKPSKNSEVNLIASDNNKTDHATTTTVVATKVSTESSTISSTSTTISTTTTTTTTTTPKPKKPTVTFSIEDVPSIANVIQEKPVSKLPTESVESPIAEPSQEFKPDPIHHGHRDYIIPIVALIFAVPIIIGAIIISYRRIKDYWSTRHYRRMDFLVDGMYND